jgi:hypothetical protein
VTVAAEKEIKRKAREEIKETRLADQRLRKVTQKTKGTLQRTKKHSDSEHSDEDLIETKKTVIRTSDRSDRIIRLSARFEQKKIQIYDL